MFYNNKYTKWYLSIVFRAWERTEDIEGVELHHILPKSILPEYQNLKIFKWNGVLLTYREHFICHWLLTKMVITIKHRKQMEKAFGGMSLGMVKRKLKSRQYEISKKYAIQATKEALIGVTYDERFGISVSNEIKEKISKANKGKSKNSEKLKQTAITNFAKASLLRKGIPLSKEIKHKISNSNKGKTKTIEQREKMSQARKLNIKLGLIKSPKQRMVVYKNVEYSSLMEAAKAYAAENSKSLNTSRVYIKRDENFRFLD